MSVIWKWPWKNDVLISQSKIENEIKKKGNKYLYFLKLTDEKDLWIGFIDFLSHFPLFWLFPFHVIYSINEIMLWLERRKKSKQWIFFNKLKTQLTIFRLRFSQKNFIAWKSNIKSTWSTSGHLFLLTFWRLFT